MSVKFYNGHCSPVIGLGTYKAVKDEAYQAVRHAIDVGYRHIDTALYYQNEKYIGQAIRDKIQDGTIKREDIFITSKLWNTFHRRDLVEKSLSESLKDLGMDYLDLYLIHWPISFKEGGELMPLEDGKVMLSDIYFTETWAAMEECVEKGLVKSIGISNFNKRQIEELLKVAKIKPVTNQVECHAYFNQEKLRVFCASKGIVITAYSPLGAPYRVKPGDPVLLEDVFVLKLAEKYGKTPGQIVLRYQIERGIIVVPKSSNKTRIQENFDLFDFKLSKEDMECLDSLTKENGRLVLFESGKYHKEYPFNELY
ncbi:aldose reductase-like isoform X3 [Cimex lectularius]|uniref:NADP-dependent oxidoreductase domain-containing protein n=1 Tax=Cimex lectularius TaxID=79782 RepID=A0A8I6S0P4_CIMLE|nr:aldose reductase-like isoform X3 [Cimex lectularius]